MVVVEAELGFSVVQFIGVAVVMAFQGLVSSLVAAGGGSERSCQHVVSAFGNHTCFFIAVLFIFGEERQSFVHHDLGGRSLPEIEQNQSYVVIDDIFNLLFPLPKSVNFSHQLSQNLQGVLIIFGVVLYLGMEKLLMDADAEAVNLGDLALLGFLEVLVELHHVHNSAAVDHAQFEEDFAEEDLVQKSVLLLLGG